MSNIGCENNDSTIYAPSRPTIPDTSIYISSFPTDVILRLRQSVRIQNAVTTFLFYSVLEDTRQVVHNEVIGNAKILLGIDYGSFQKYIELNTVKVPGSYSLENGMHYSIQLKDVMIIDSVYHIKFQFNEYKHWRKYN
jgi:hypothetical protein